jgi:hypothetical protein
MLAAAAGDQVVQFSEHERRKHAPLRAQQHLRRGGVLGLAWVDRGEYSARVEQDHRWPKPAR